VTDLTQPQNEHDQLLQATCEAIVQAAASAVDAEPPTLAKQMNLPGVGLVGKQITIDATGEDGLLNMCRMSVLNPDVAPEGEIVRMEFEHEKEGKFGKQMVYSIQSVRRRAGQFVLLENFLAERPEEVREEDFRQIESESYAQETVLKTLKDWAGFRRWQLQGGRK
jgi:hypothetical protein